MPAVVVAHQGNNFPRDGSSIAEWHQYSSVFGQQFRGMPVWRGHYRFARAERICEGSRRNLLFIQVGRYVQVGGADEFFQILKFHEIVVEDDVLFDLVLLGEHFQAHAVSFAMLAEFIRMGCAQDNINNLGKFLQNLRQGVEHILDALIRRKQAEREKHASPFHSELILEISWIDESNIGNPMCDEVDLGGWRLVDVPQ